MKPKQSFQESLFSGWWMFWAVAATTLISIGISIFCLNAGTFIVFQNVLYVPIILACVGYPKRGFVFSVGLALFYYFLIHEYTNETGVLHQAQVRTAIFIVVASVVAYLSHIRKQTEGKLERLRRENELILQSAKDGTFGLDAKGNHAFVNAEAARMLGWEADELLGRNSHATWHHTREDGSFYPEKECPIFTTLRDGLTHQGEEYFLRQDGTGFPVEFTSASMLDKSGKIVGAVVTFRDITERKRAEEVLQRSEQRYRSLFLDVPVPFYLTDLDGKFIDVNSAFAELLGYPSREYVIEKVSIDDIFIITHERILWRDRIKREKKVTDFETQVRCSDGTLIWVVDEAVMMHTPRGIRFRGSLQNVEKLKTQAATDPLTGLFNRRYMEDFLEKVIQRATCEDAPVGIIMLDIDHFKKYNDDFGHDAGDAVLKGLSELLMKYIRPSDIACRYGGEEFLLILPGASKEIARQRAEDILEAVRDFELNHRGNGFGQITISAGVAVFPEHGGIADDLIRAADIALYRAKEEGRDRVVVAV